MPVQDSDIAACVGHYRALLDAAPQPPTSLSHTPDSRLDVILRKAGAKRRTPALLARLEDAFTAAGVTTFPPLTDPDLDTKERVYFFEDLKAHAQRHGFDSAHLILIAGQPDLSVRTRVEQFAAARGLSVTFLLYRVHMKLHPHP